MTPKAAVPAPVAKAVPEPKVPDSALLQSFKAARRCSTPLLAIETPDAAATILAISKTLNGKAPTLQWDIVRGLKGLNKLGEQALATALAGTDPNQTVNGVSACEVCERLPEFSAVFFHNAHRQFVEPAFIQAVWNLRDVFKVNRRTWIGLGPNFQLPSELAGDIVVLDEPLPTRDELAIVLEQQHKNAEGVPLPTPEIRDAALDAVVGLANFTAEQVIAMSLTPKGVDVAKLWDRKIKAIENTDGLRVWKGTESSLDFLQGIDNAKAFMQQLIDAEAFGAIVFIDEGDKAFAGGMSDYTGDSGVSKDQVGTVLSYIEDTRSLGILLAGIAGTGKTELAKATAASAKKPLIIFDLGGMKGGTVGQSERTIRTALKVVTATAEGRVLFVMTANKTTQFTPELNRRFPDQFFHDVPDDLGRAAIWPVYVQKYGLMPAQAKIPAGFDAGWTGAEIRRACERAALFGKTVVEAARFIIPQSVSAKTVIASLRRDAAGRFLSASYPGLYQMPDESTPVLASHRSIELQ